MTTIPYHRVDVCKNAHSRLAIFDELMECGIFAGGHEATRNRVKALNNGEFLLKEYDFYSDGTSCCTCFWALLYKNLGSWRGGEQSDSTASVHYVEITTSKEDLTEDDCLHRLFRQKSDPIDAYAYVVQDLDEGQCLIRMLYRTSDGHPLKKRTLDRVFPVDSDIKYKMKITSMEKQSLLNDPDCIKKDL